MSEKKALAIILVLALALRLCLALIVPDFDKPDEKPHFEYIKYVADNKKLPIQESQGGEFFQPPLYHVLASLFLIFIRIFTENEHYLILSLRLLSIVASIVTLYFIYKIASAILKKKELALGAVTFAAFLPSHASINSTITNANFADLLATLILYLLLKLMMGEKSQKIVFALGLLSGIAMLTRISLLPLLAVIPLAFIARFYPDIRHNIKNILKPLIIIGIITLAISSWSLVRNYSLYGDPLGINAMHISSPQDDINPDLSFIARLIGWTFVTFWAAFGRTNGIFIGSLDSGTGIFIFSLFYLLLLAFTLASLYGLLNFIRKYQNNRNILDITQKKYIIIAGMHLTLMLLAFISFNFYDFQPQGRLFFPAMSTIAILFTLGIYNIFDEKHRKKAFNAYFAFFILLGIISIVSLSYHYLA